MLGNLDILAQKSLHYYCISSGVHAINLHICLFRISNEFEHCSNFIFGILHMLTIMHECCKRRRDLWPPYT